ncbi:MFS transporter [Bacteroidaceae bacterium HV4-6-C5C]|nr:MFS transporter [Bacteroidaceae bacterium HV4-6-C5C]
MIRINKYKLSPKDIQKGIPTSLIILMSISAGISVANIYYNQPILMDIASDFKTSESQAGLISMLSQIGYGLGLFFITPLGDKFNKKSLIIGLQALLFIALTFIFFTTTIAQVWLLSIFISLFSVSVQVIMPMTAGMSTINRGKNVGTIFTGVLIGILSARVFSGAIADLLGWRYVYLISAVAVGISTLLLFIYLPNSKSSFSGNYPQLLGSAISQFRKLKFLRHLSYIGMLQFGLFCSFWTTLTFHLSNNPFNYSSSKIGLLGIVAIAGALIAPYMGKTADKEGATKVRLSAISLTIISITIMFFFQNSIAAIILGTFLLDVGAQSLQVTNTALLYKFDESLHSRINTIYMTLFFTGGALGTFIGIMLWEWGGWNFVMSQMFCFSIIILFLLRKEKNRYS